MRSQACKAFLLAATLDIVLALSSTPAGAQLSRERPVTPEGPQRPDYEPPALAKPLDGCGWHCLEFPIHIVVLANNPKAVMSEARAREEVDILNRYFVTATGKRLATFYYKSHRLYQEIRGVPREKCSLAYLANEEPHDGDAFNEAFNDCDASDIRDPNAINVYIYDDFVWPSDQSSVEQLIGERKKNRPKRGSPPSGSLLKDRSPRGGHGRKNKHQPYILLDYERLPHVQAAEEHEMGHAFGLNHIFYEKATRNSDTNIMASSKADCGGSGGERNLGFDAGQSQTVMETAELIYEKLSAAP